MLKFITATDSTNQEDIMINLDQIIKIQSDPTGRALFTDINGYAFTVEEPLGNIAASIRLIQAAQLSQKGGGSDD